VTRNSIEELIKSWRSRYHSADRKGKTKILDEFVALTGYHHKAAIRAFKRNSKARLRFDRPGLLPLPRTRESTTM
jgi:hypothetical protein